MENIESLHNHRERIEAVQDRLKCCGAVAAVFGLSSNLLYLTGFRDEPGERALLLFVPAEGDATMLVPLLYEDQVRAQQPPVCLATWADGEDPMRRIREFAESLGDQPGQMLVDDSLWAMFLVPLQMVFSERSFTLATDLMSSLRMFKGPTELEAMVRAGAVSDEALESVLSEPIVGLTELALASRLEQALLRFGADSVACETIVASGPNSALPHHRAGTRRILKDDVVILDFGCRVNGYCSDTSRTIVCGDPTQEIEKVFAAVRKAHQAAWREVRIGTPAEAVDAAARQILVEAGYGPHFTHRTGHGIGLDIHEPPYIVSGNKTPLVEGMTFSIEPGVYFTGRFGVRVEDVVRVGPDTAQPMTRASRALRSIR